MTNPRKFTKEDVEYLNNSLKWPTHIPLPKRKILDAIFDKMDKWYINSHKDPESISLSERTLIQIGWEIDDKINIIDPKRENQICGIPVRIDNHIPDGEFLINDSITPKAIKVAEQSRENLIKKIDKEMATPPRTILETQFPTINANETWLKTHGTTEMEQLVEQQAQQINKDTP